jgi:hypothetical protein
LLGHCQWQPGIGFEAIGAYIEKLEDEQNGTDGLARRLQVVS